MPDMYIIAIHRKPSLLHSYTRHCPASRSDNPCHASDGYIHALRVLPACRLGIPTYIMAIGFIVNIDIIVLIKLHSKPVPGGLPCCPPDITIRPPARRAYAPARSNQRAAGNRLICKVLLAKSRTNFEAESNIHPVFGLLQGLESLRHTPIFAQALAPEGRLWRDAKTAKTRSFGDRSQPNRSQ
jgi:hypothetical protein